MSNKKISGLNEKYFYFQIGLRQIDMNLLCQLWTLNEQIQTLKKRSLDETSEENKDDYDTDDPLKEEEEEGLDDDDDEVIWTQPEESEADGNNQETLKEEDEITLTTVRPKGKFLQNSKLLGQ